MDRQWSGKKILVVEEEPDMCLFVANLLAANGFQVLVAGNSVEAMKMARINYPDLIILDAMLADGEGIAFFRSLRKEIGCENIPVVVMSTIDRKTFCHYQRCMGVREIFEPEAFLGRPPEAEELLGAIEALSRA